MNLKMIYAVVALMMLGCGSEQSVQSVQGPGSETIAFTGRADYATGLPASGATVTARKQHYLAALPDQKNQADTHHQTVTDSEGRFSLSIEDSGVYLIEINDHNRYAGLVRCTTTTAGQPLPKKTLIPTGTITGAVLPRPNTSVFYARVYGMERVVEIDPLDGTFSIPDMPEGTYDLIVASSDTSTDSYIIDTQEVISDSTTHTGTIDVTTGTVLKHSRTITLNTTSSGAQISEDVYNFPVLLRLTPDNFVFDQAAPNGSDIRFTKSDHSSLAHRIERWDGDRGKAELWIRVDTIFANSNTQSIRMYWGDSEAKLNQSVEVFDTAAGFQAVYQFNDPVIDTLRDATLNNYHGVYGGYQDHEKTDAIIGAGFSFDGISDYYTLTNTAQSRLNFSDDDTYAISAWVYADTLNNYHRSIFSMGDHHYGLQLHVTNTWELFHFKEASGWSAVRVAAQQKTWVLLTGIYDRGNMSLYVNGELAGEEIIFLDQEVTDSNHDACIGKMAENTARFWDGKMDEIRVGNVARSGAWIKLCFMNQKPEDALLEFDPIGLPESN